MSHPVPAILVHTVLLGAEPDLPTNWSPIGPVVVDTLSRYSALLEVAFDEVMLIGGAQLYEQALPLAERLYLTRVALSPAGDAWFPSFEGEAWQRTACTEHAAEGETPGHSYEIWQRQAQ